MKLNKKQLPPKTPVLGARKSPQRVCKPSKTCQKYVRKSDIVRPYKSIVQNNLSHLVAKTKNKSIVKKYTDIAKILSRIAHLSDGHVWSWRYVISIHKGTMQPSKKFTRALNAYIQNQDTGKQRRCYFASRHGVIVVFDTSVMVDVIAGQLRGMGYHAVTYARYNQVRKMSAEAKAQQMKARL